MDKMRIVRQAARLENAGFKNARFNAETSWVRMRFGAVTSVESGMNTGVLLLMQLSWIVILHDSAN